MNSRLLPATLAEDGPAWHRGSRGARSDPCHRLMHAGSSKRSGATDSRACTSWRSGSASDRARSLA